jgi:hypothetical protein
MPTHQTMLDIKYVCPNCGHEWEEQWSSACDSECPECDTDNIEATSWEDAEVDEYKLRLTLGRKEVFDSVRSETLNETELSELAQKKWDSLPNPGNTATQLLIWDADDHPQNLIAVWTPYPPKIQMME